MIRLLIIHNQPLFRAGLRALLGRQDDMVVIGETIEHQQILEVAATRPDVVLFDTATTSYLPYRAAEVVAQLREAGAQGIIVFAASMDEEGLFRFLMAGAAAYEPTSIGGDELAEKIRCVANGEYMISSEVLRNPATKKPSRREVAAVVSAPVKKSELIKTPPSPSPLSAREMEVLRLILIGQDNRGIARMLDLSVQTVKHHVAAIFQKFEVNNRTSAVVTALRRNFISLENVDLSHLVLDREAFAQRAHHYQGTQSRKEVQREGVLSLALANV